MADLGVKTIAGIPSVIGGLTSLAASPIALATGRSFHDSFDMNPINSLATTMDKWGSDYFPTFQTDEFQQRGFFGQLSSPGQMLTSNINTLAFLAQGFGVAGLLGKAKLGAKVAERVSKGDNIWKSLAELTGPNMAKLGGNIDAITTNMFLTTNEAAMEAKESFETGTQKLQWARINGLNEFTDEEIKDKADNASYNTFWENMLTLAVTNGAFVKLTAPLRGTKAAASRANKLGLELSNDGLTQAKKLSGFEKFLFDKGYTPGVLTKSLVGQAISEGMEESLQYSIQKVNALDNKNLDFFSSLSRYGTDALTHSLDLSDPDRLKAFGLGALFGMGGTVGATGLGAVGFKDLGPVNQAKNFRQKQQDAIASLNNGYTDLLSASTIAKEPVTKGKVYSKEVDGQTKFYNETPDRIEEIEPRTYLEIKNRFKVDADGNYTTGGGIILDDQGNVVKDPVKVTKFAAAAATHTALDDLIETENSLSPDKVNEFKVQLYQQEKLRQLANDAFESGATQLLIDKLEAFRDQTPEQQASIGIEDPTIAKEHIDGMIEHVKAMETLWNTLQNSTEIGSTSIKENLINTARRSVLRSQGARILTLDEITKKLKGKHSDLLSAYLSEIDPNNVKEVEKRLTQIAGVFTAEQGFENLFPSTSSEERLTDELDPATFTEKEKEIAKLASQIELVKDAREDLGKKFQELLEPRKGFEKFKKNFEAATPTGAYIDTTGKFTSPYDAYAKRSFEVKPDVTEQDFNRFESRRLKSLRFSNKIQHAQSAFFADAINEFIKYLDVNGYTVETAESLVTLVNKIIDKKLALYPDEASKLYKIINDFVSTVKQEIQNKAQEIEARSINELNDYLTPEENAILDNYYALLEVEKALGALGESPDKFIMKLVNLESINEPSISDVDLKKQIAAELLASPMSVLDAANYQLALEGPSISEDYTDAVRVEYEIDRLKILIANVLSPKSSDAAYTQAYRNAKDLLKALEDIQKLIRNNLNNRTLQDRKQDEFFANGSHLIWNELEQAIKDANFDAATLGKLKALTAIDPVLASSAINELISSLKEGDFNDTISLQEEAIHTALANLSIFKLKGFIDIDLSKAEIEAAINSPVRVFNHIFRQIEKKESTIPGKKNLAPLTNFLKDYDIVKFRSTVGMYEGSLTAPELESVIDLYSKAVALKQIKNSKSSTFSAVSYLNDVLNFVTTQSKLPKPIPAPSSSQQRVTRELTNFFLAPFDTRNRLYDNGASLKAPAGAGKSLVVAPLLKATAHLNGDQILTCAHAPLAARNIKDGVGSTHEPYTVDQLTELLEKGVLPAQVKLLILDEAGAYDVAQIFRFAVALAQYNIKNAGKEVKFLMIYDPNQITPGNIGTSSLEAYSYSDMPSNEPGYWNGDDVKKKEYEQGQYLTENGIVKPHLLGSLPFIQNLTSITSLSSTYRSDVSEIVDAQNRFKSAQEVENVYTATNVNPLNNPKDLLGSYAENGTTNLLAILQASSTANPARTKAIIVGSKEKADRWKSILADRGLVNVNVLTAPEAQGTTIDEVYADITTTDQTNFSDPALFNQYMYTALSRASKFVYIGNTTGTTNVDASIDERVKKSQDSKKSSFTDSIDVITKQLETLRDILGTTVPNIKVDPVLAEEKPDPNEVKQEEQNEVEKEDDKIEEVTSDEIENEPQDVAVPVVIEEEDLPYDERPHKLWNPQSTFFSTIEGFQTPDINTDQEVMFVRDISDNKSRILVVTKLKDDKGIEFPNLYRLAGILSESEVAEVSNKLGSGDLNKLTGYDFIKDLSIDPSGNIFRVGGGIDVTDFTKGIISRGSHDLTYVYGNTATHDFSSKSPLKSLLTRFLNDFFGGNPNHHVENLSDVMTNPEEFLQILSYKSEKQVREDFPEALSDRERPKIGPPYLVISGLKMRNGGIMRKQFIRLIPSVMSTSGPSAANTGIEHILNHIGKVKEFEKQIEALKLPAWFGEMALGKGFNLDKKNTYYPFHRFVIELSEAYRRMQLGQDAGTISVSAQSNEALNAKLPKLDAKIFPEAVLKLAYELDVLTHGREEFGATTKRSYNGKAQNAMDAIGSQNLVVTLPNGKTKILRVYRTTTFKQGGELTSQEELGGISLLGPLKFEQNNSGLSYNSYARPKLLARLKTYRDNLAQRNPANKNSSRYQAISAMVDSTVPPIMVPTTLEDLEQLFIKSQDKNGKLTGVSEGFGLRNPMPVYAFSKAYYQKNTINDLSLFGVVETNFNTVVPTTIAVSKVKSEIETPAAPPSSAISDVSLIRQKIESMLDDSTDAEIMVALRPYDLVSNKFLEVTGYATLQEAITGLRQLRNQQMFYTKLNESIYNSIRAIATRMVGKPLKERILNSLLNSKDVTDMGRNEGKYAARDFMRAAFLLEMFPGLPKEKYMELIDIARTNYSSKSEEAKYDFYFKIEKLGQSISNPISQQDIAAYLSEFTGILDSQGVPTQSPDVNLFDVMEYVAAKSSEFRNLQREGKLKPTSFVPAEAITVEGIEAPTPPQQEELAPYVPALPAITGDLEGFLTKLYTAANQPGNAFDDLLAKRSSKKHVEEFLKIIGKSEIDEDTVYEDVIKAMELLGIERSMTMSNEDIGELLSDEEVEEAYNKLKPPTLMSMIRKVLGMRGSEGYAIVEANSLINSKGEQVWGLYKDGMMAMARHSSGKVGNKILRHEFFHQAFWNYLTVPERMAALAMAKDTWGDADVITQEERLAEAFADHKAGKDNRSLLQRIFDKILRFLGFTFNTFNTLEMLFDSLDQGKYGVQRSKTESKERSMLIISRHFDTVQEFRFAKDTLLSTFSQVINSRRQNGIVLSFDEALKYSFDRIKDMVERPVATDEYTSEFVKNSLSKLLSPKTKKAFVEEYFGQLSASSANIASLAPKYKDRLAELYDQLKNIQEDAEDGDNVSEEDQDRINAINSELDGIKAEIFDSALSDPKQKITGRVKQRLVSIEYNKNGQKTYAEFQKVFSIILNKMHQVDASSLENLTNDIVNKFKIFGGAPGVLKNSIRAATGKFMLDVAQNISDNLRPTSKLRRDISFRKDANHLDHYVILSRDKSSTEAVTLFDAQKDKNKYVVVFQLPETSMQSFANDIRAALPTLSQEDINRAYYFFEDVNFVRSLVAAVGSLRENKPYVGVQYWNYGQYRTYYVENRSGGALQVLESAITNKFDEYVKGRTTTLFADSFIQDINAAKTFEEKKAAILSFVRTIGIEKKGSKIRSATEAEIDNMWNPFAQAMRQMDEQFKLEIPSQDFSKELFIATKTGAGLLSDQGSFVNALVGALNNYSDLVENNSYMRGDGKKAYKFIDASYQSSLLSSIYKAFRGERGRSFSTFRPSNIKGKLLSSDRFISRSMYANAKSAARILGFIDHDSMKTKGNDQWAKYLDRENDNDFRKRNFALGFLNRLATSSSGSYYQFLPIPSNRSSIQAAEVSVLNLDEAKTELANIIKNEKTRPRDADLMAVKTYASNVDKFKVPGLVGKVDSLTENEALAAVEGHVNARVAELLEFFIHKEGARRAEVDIDVRHIENALHRFKINVKGWKTNFAYQTEKRAAQAKEDPTELNKLLAEREATMRDAVGQLLKIYYMNSIVHNYSLSQLLYGDEAFYKSKEDETKRIQIATATGDVLLVDNNHGLPERSKVMVVDDLSIRVPDDLEFVRGDSYRDTLDSTDAEGFMLPEFYEKVARAYGIEASTDVILKPVYFSIEKGVPTAIKYSVKVLTDDLVKQYPHLEGYRSQMRKSGADQLVFKSAVKVGLPSKIASLDENGQLLNETVGNETFLDIDNQFLRFQLNPAKDTDTTVANASQITSFINSNGMNEAEMQELYNLNSYIIENGLRNITRDMKLTRKGGLTKRSITSLRDMMKRAAENLPGSRDLFNLLSFKNPETKEGISLSLPLIADKAVSTISSMISKSTVGFRFGGSKLVLQSEVGTYKGRPLQYKDADGYTEVVLPESYRPYFQVGDVFTGGNKDGLVGFRIPSTNYHSALALKVVDFYPAPPNSEANVIIAPSLIVYYHGSDYDVDTLFVIKKGQWEAETEDLNELLANYTEDYEDNENLIIKKGQFVGYNDEGAVMVDGQPLYAFLNDYIIKIHQRIEKLTDTLFNGSKAEASEARKKIDNHNKILETISKVADQAAKNAVVGLLSSNLANPKNRRDLLTPISFARVAAIKSKMQKELFELLSSKDEAAMEEFLNELEEAKMIEKIC